MSAGPRRLLLEGLAQVLDDAGVATFRADGSPYTDAETAITLGALPQRPASALALAVYDAQDDPAHADTVVSVQVRSRAAGTTLGPTDDLADAAWSALQGLGPTTLPTGVHIVTGPTRVNSAPLGQDNGGRWERVDSYRVTIHSPAPHRL